MSKVSIQGDQNGTGDFTIKAPNSNTDRTLTIPDSDGEFLFTDSNGDLSVDGDTFYVDSANGRVGVGTSSPSFDFEVFRSGPLNSIFESNTGNSNVRIVSGDDDDCNIFFGDQTNGTIGGITWQNSDNSLSITNNGLVPALSVDSSNNLKFNSGYGSVATAYGCRAWVNFSGDNNLIVRGSGNVSSVTDRGEGRYTVNFATDMPDTVYTVAMATLSASSANLTAANALIEGSGSSGINPPLNRTESAIALVHAALNGNLVDSAEMYVSIFR